MTLYYVSSHLALIDQGPLSIVLQTKGVSQCVVTVIGDLVNDTAKWAYRYSINQTPYVRDPEYQVLSNCYHIYSPHLPGPIRTFVSENTCLWTSKSLPKHQVTKSKYGSLILCSLDQVLLHTWAGLKNTSGTASCIYIHPAQTPCLEPLGCLDTWIFEFLMEIRPKCHIRVGIPSKTWYGSKKRGNVWKNSVLTCQSSNLKSVLSKNRVWLL